GAEARSERVLRSCHHRLECILADLLLKDAPSAVTLGLKQHRFAVQGPGSGRVIGFVISQPPKGTHTRPPCREFAHVNRQLRCRLQERQPLPIRTCTQLSDVRSLPLGDAFWHTSGREGLTINTDLPNVVVTRAWRFLPRVDDPLVWKPAKIAQGQF